MAKRRTKGEGTIYFNDASQLWIAQITLPHGKRKSKSSKTQKEVRDWLIKQRNMVREGIFVIDDKVKLGEFLYRYMKDVAEPSLRETTLQSQYSLIRNHIEPELGNIRLSALRPDQVQRFYTKKLNEGLSKRTVRYMHAILHKSLNQALKWGLIPRNVTDLVDAPKPKRKPPKTWSSDQAKRFLMAASDHRWYPIYVIAIYCGLREGEILGLHKNDIDLDRGVIHIRHQAQYIVGKGMIINQPKTEKSMRPVTIPKTALEILRDHIENIGGEQELVFATSTGNPISPSNLVKHFKEVSKAVGLPKIRFHDLRHTHASLLLEAGVHPKIVQERLGHSQISLTLDTYSHVVPSLGKEAAEKFESILS